MKIKMTVNYETMEPAMLLSMVNMWLRDNYNTLDELCNAKDFNRTILEQRLKQIDYIYDPKQNQFK